MTESEKHARGNERPDPGPWLALLRARDADAAATVIAARPPARRPAWAEAAVAGGFPPAALTQEPRTRAAWFDGYVRTYLERDLQTLARITALADFRRLMRLAALRVGQFLNQSQLARDAGLPQATAHRYLNLLETSHQIIRLGTYATSRSKRLIKAPRLFWNDTGLAAFLGGATTAEDVLALPHAGALLENLVVTHMLAWRETEIPHPEILVWRTTAGLEVDLVIETARTLLPIEVKATARPRVAEARPLEVFLDEYPRRASYGLLVHTGAETLRLSARVIAAPLARLL